MKKGIHLVLTLLLAIVLVGSLALSACAAPTTTTTNTTTTKPPVAVEAIKLKYASTAVPGTFLHTTQEKYLDMIEAKAGGKIKFDRFYGGSLGNDREIMPLCRQGAVDVINTFVVFFNKPEEIPTYECLQTPLWIGMDKGYIANNQMQFDIPATSIPLTEEANKYGIQPLAWQAIGTYAMMTNFEVKNFQTDLKGKKLNAYGAYDRALYAKVGVIPVTMLATELYEGVSRKVIDGAYSGMSTLTSFKIYEVAKSFIDTNEGLCSGFTCMNLAKWKTLSPDIQKAFADARKDYIPWCLEFTKSDYAKMYDTYKKAVAFYPMTADDKKIITDTQNEVANGLVKTKTEQGNKIVQIWYDNWAKMH